MAVARATLGHSCRTAKHNTAGRAHPAGGVSHVPSYSSGRNEKGLTNHPEPVKG